MKREIEMTIQNKLAVGERDINVFHHSSRSAHIISHNSSVTLPLRNAGEKDYLFISVVRGPGYSWVDCVISMRAWVDFDFSSEGKLSVTHSGNAKRILLKIPPGPPTWELKVCKPTGLPSSIPLTVLPAEHVTISDNGSDEVG